MLVSYRYLGNKTKLADWIVGNISKIVPFGSSIADPMCGTASVSIALAKAGYSVTAADALKFPVMHARARLLAKEPPLFLPFGGYKGILDWMNTVEPVEGYFFNEFGAAGKPANGRPPRLYFSANNAAHIDGVRIGIKNFASSGIINEVEHSVLIHHLILATNRVANISGTYGYFRSKLSEQAIRPILFEPITFINTRRNHTIIQSSATSGGVISASRWLSMNDKTTDILSAWGENRNVLLYGPPATGKTRLISELYVGLSAATVSDSYILLDPNNTAKPFSRHDYQIPIPIPVKVIWTTFHQSYSYKDFVLGLIPKITKDTTTLVPQAGVLLDAILELSDPNSIYKSVVILIDEVNRGNAARIFGEFMTFLDFDYREGGRIPIPIPLRQIHYTDGVSETIYRINGSTMKIPEGLTFPKDIYIVATMNSVDRSAVPVDSALARRFNRIEMRPNLNELSIYWGIDETKLQTPTDSDFDSLDPSDVVYENYVYWLCNRAARKLGIRVTKATIKFGDIIRGEGTVLETTPDVIFRDSQGHVIAITDAKYKHFGSRPKAADTYQLLAASQILGCPRVSLTYPVDDNRMPTVWKITPKHGGGDIQLTALPLNLMLLSELDGPRQLISNIYDWLDNNSYSGG